MSFNRNSRKRKILVSDSENHNQEEEEEKDILLLQKHINKQLIDNVDQFGLELYQTLQLISQIDPSTISNQYIDQLIYKIERSKSLIFQYINKIPSQLQHKIYYITSKKKIKKI